MKVFIEAWSARLGGGQTYLRNLLAFIPDDEALEVHVFAPPELELPKHDRLFRRTTRWPVTNPLLRLFWQVLVLAVVLRRENADVLFCPGGLVLTRAPRRCRVVTMFRNMIPFDPVLLDDIPELGRRLRQRILRRLMLRSMRKADKTIFISSYCRDLIEGMIPLKGAETIYHGIPNRFRDASEKPVPSGLSTNSYLLYVSRFDVYKHQYELVKAYAMMPAAIRQLYPLVLVGEAESREAARVKKQVDSLGLTGQVIIQGAVPYEELPSWYAHAAVNLFMSSCENCPNILLEAMSSGRPVVCSNIPPMPEFSQQATKLVNPKDPKDIVSALLEVLGSKELSDDLAEKAIKRSACFDWPVSASQTWSALLK